MDKEALINGYFEDNLSQEALEAFNHLLESDAEFASEVTFRRSLQTALKKEERQQIKTMFRSLEGEQVQKSPRVISLRSWLAAASIAMVVSLGSWFFFFNTQMNPDELYHINFAPYENVVHPLERGNQLEDLKTRAFEAYESQDYPEALELFGQLNDLERDPYIDFYSAIVMMQLNQHQEAIVLLNNYLAGGGDLQDRARWYLALAYLKVGKIYESKKELNELISAGDFNTKRARELLEKLN